MFSRDYRNFGSHAMRLERMMCFVVVVTPYHVPFTALLLLGVKIAKHSKNPNPHPKTIFGTGLKAKPESLNLKP